MRPRTFLTLVALFLIFDVVFICYMMFRPASSQPDGSSVYIEGIVTDEHQTTVHAGGIDVDGYITIRATNDTKLAQTGQEFKAPSFRPQNDGIKVGDKVRLECTFRFGELHQCQKIASLAK